MEIHYFDRNFSCINFNNNFLHTNELTFLKIEIKISNAKHEEGAYIRTNFFKFNLFKTRIIM